MADSDDEYFGEDDLILDEATIAILDAEENKFKAKEQQTQITNPSPEPPPTKKQKIDHVVTGPKLQRRTTSGSDGWPEISIDGNAYDFGHKPKPPTSYAQPSISRHNNTHNNIHIKANNVQKTPPVSFQQQRSTVPAPARQPSGHLPANATSRVQHPIAGSSRPPIQREPSVPQLTQRLNGASISQNPVETPVAKSQRSLRFEVEILKTKMEEVCDTRLFSRFIYYLTLVG